MISTIPQSTNRKQPVNRRPFFESLESRYLLSGWHNQLNPIDVDASGLVTSLDVLSVINDLNAHGLRLLPFSQPSDEPQRFVDVNNDSRVTPLDMLLIINALNENQGPLNFALSITPGADPNGNGVILQDQVTLLGQTAAQARVQFTVDALGVDLKPVPNQSRSTELRTDRTGSFQILQELSWGLNQVTAKATDRLGRVLFVQREIVRGDLVADWNAAMLNVVRDWTATSNDPYPGRIVPSAPPVVARNLAMLHVAMFDAINGVSNQYEAYAFARDAPPDTSTIAAAASAAFEVAVELYPDARELAIWQATFAESLATVEDGPAKQQGISFGRDVAKQILAARANDGSTATTGYVPGTVPGDWNRTEPDRLPPLVPHWGNVRPMAMEDISQFRASPPPALASEEYAISVDEVMRLGRVDSSERTTEQTEIALFWVDGGGSATPPGHWNRIASRVSLAKGEPLLDGARTMALLNLALVDAGIASWDSKYQYDHWRPIDAIRRANEDGNDATVVDANWLPLIRTPPFPAYTSGHSTFSAAAAEVLTVLFGENFSFASRSDGHTGLTQKPLAAVSTRQFTSFRSAADEAGMSRIYGGIHFQFDNVAGALAGRAIGEQVTENWLIVPSA